MRKLGSIWLASVFLASASFSQQTSQPQPAVNMVAASLNLGSAPTPSDMYCSGYLTTEKVSNKLYVAGGHNSPDQTIYAGNSDTIFIHGQGIKEGERYQILRHVQDRNNYELFRGQKAAIRNAGEVYFEMAIVRVSRVQKDTGIASFELNCADVIPGDIAIPLVERESPPFRKVSLDRYAPPSGKPQGRIIMAKEFDYIVGSKHKVYLNIGSDKGLKPGDYLKATRTYSYSFQDPEDGLSFKASEYESTQVHPQRLPTGEVSSLPRRTLGDMIVLQVHARSATAMVLTALEGINVGDVVEVMDTSDAQVLPPLHAPFAKPAQPDAAAAAAAAATAMPPRISCTASPTSLHPGESATINCDAVSPDNRQINVTYVANGGKLSSNRNQATLDTTDAGPGPIAVRATAFDDRQLSASTVITVNVEASTPPTPTAQKQMELEFRPASTYVDNRSKAVLDDVALKMQQDPNLNAVLSGSADPGEAQGIGLRRAQNAMGYLSQSKGIDAHRIQTKAGAEPGRKVEIWTLPAGAQIPATEPPKQDQPK